MNQFSNTRNIYFPHLIHWTLGCIVIWTTCMFINRKIWGLCLIFFSMQLWFLKSVMPFTSLNICVHVPWKDVLRHEISVEERARNSRSPSNLIDNSRLSEISFKR